MIVAPHRVWRNRVPFTICTVVKCMTKISICCRHLRATTALKDKSKNHSKNWRERALENRRYKNLAELAVVHHKMSKALVTEFEDREQKKIKKKEMVGYFFLLLQSFLRMIQMHFICLHCKDAIYIASQMALTIQQKRSG